MDLPVLPDGRNDGGPFKSYVSPDLAGHVLQLLKGGGGKE